MSERVSNLVGGICGLRRRRPAWSGGFPFTGATPEPGASVDKVAEYLDRSGAQTWTGIYMEFFGLALFIVLVGRLWAILREAEGARGLDRDHRSWRCPRRSDRAFRRRRDGHGCSVLGRATRCRSRCGRRHVHGAVVRRPRVRRRQRGVLQPLPRCSFCAAVRSRRGWVGSRSSSRSHSLQRCRSDLGRPWSRRTYSGSCGSCA